MIEDIIVHNRKFVAERGYEPYETSKYPDKKLAILTCMDTRLTELLPAALGIRNGDAKIIKNAGGVISHPYGSAVRSLLVAILELGVEEIMVITHTNCGVASITPGTIRSHLAARGIAKETINRMEAEGLDFNLWFQGFETPQEEAERTVSLLRTHPLLPRDVKINGFVIDVVTGRLEPVN